MAAKELHSTAKIERVTASAPTGLPTRAGGAASPHAARSLAAALRIADVVQTRCPSPQQRSLAEWVVQLERNWRRSSREGDATGNADRGAI